MKKETNLLDLFNTVGSLFNTLSKIKVPSQSISNITKLVNDNKNNIIAGTALVTATATLTTAVNNKKTSKKVQNSFKEGIKKGEIETKNKFSKILTTQKKRDEFLLLMAKIGSHIAKLDGNFSEDEKNTIKSFIGTINLDSPSTHEIIRIELENIIESTYNSDELIKESVLFLNELKIDRKYYVEFMDQLIVQVIKSDGIEHKLETEFYDKWRKKIKK